jgi:glycosyltransferase involved in cell wall biosynthesis
MEASIATSPCELSFVMPCLDEAETLASSIRNARDFLVRHSINGEVVVADNGSSDGSADIASAAGARVVHVAERGYGSALMGGILAAAAAGRAIRARRRDRHHTLLCCAVAIEVGFQALLFALFA